MSETDVLAGENCETLVDCRELSLRFWEVGTVVFVSALADDTGVAASTLLLEDGVRYFHIAKVYEHMKIRIMFMKLRARVLLSSGMLAMPKGASVVHRASRTSMVVTNGGILGEAIFIADCRGRTCCFILIALEICCVFSSFIG